MIEIATVCGMGLGTSMMLASQIRGLLEEEGIDGKVQPIDLGSFKSQPSDIVVTTSAMADQVGGTRATVVAIDNLVDKDEIRTKVLSAVNEINAG
ncbi:MAG: PTS sugar transporter subunit IIB [Corynebacterium sp.]|uniref:PTS sugar transporter subunit IIB n=1 Tax=Corynebacterium sp. TaxID=1720 RepID=UPI0026475A92|nr:PTS sugar transporter subunit IIB [Corynebacterium sp.]MDN6281719.1 PTS sugar transporter subunit IIB [Corynebacterium sp.]MDN6304207.1 PTS sugar transporter subunit IIB [Corynebacterium sp.]MDN6351774.1 PTS sugar transporter subunit IIB [Corynebacterium sp.]MDN6367504.1 PTS sugar transporter subunit IIB [Corynebacterium sp.]MDN6374713.1 PTS sugar transporter subunit IIB [Corynebacterium sp.]